MPLIVLRPYTENTSYPEIFSHNFREVDGIARHESIDYLLRCLSSRLEIPFEIMLIECKRYIMTSHEYHPQKISSGLPYAVFAAARFCAAMIFSVFQTGLPARTTLIIDDWSPGVGANFYGEELIAVLRARTSVAVAHGRQLLHVSFSRLMSCLDIYARAWLIGRRVPKETGIGMTGFINYVVRAAAAGLTLRDGAMPSVILSGNDNGFPVILAAASGAKLALVQNARKTLFSDASFKYADIFFAMADIDRLDITARTGCVLRSMIPLGSIRLAHARLDEGVDDIPASDITWISDLEYTEVSEGTFGRYYSMRHELDAIRLLNSLAERTQWKIIFKCRNNGEVELLKSLGLYSDKITYIGRFEMNTYQVAMKAEVILSTISSVVMEMMGVGKRGGFVNLSGNTNVNADLTPFGLEYTRNDVAGLQQFIEGLRKMPPVWHDIVKQNPQYDACLMETLEKMLPA